MEDQQLIEQRNYTSSLLADFDPISLKELDQVKLLNRVDTKFAFSFCKLPSILKDLVPHYSILEIKGVRLNNYNSIYFDSSELDLYLKHHNERKKRFKMRYRKYVDSGLSFFEIKFKNNKGRTDKRRVRTEDIYYQFDEKAVDLMGKGPYAIDPELYRHSIDIDFYRFTMADKDFTERATIDVQLTFKRDEENWIYDQIVIAELKQEKLDRTSHLMRTLKNYHILPMRMSKYCMGILAAEDAVKANRFKNKKRIFEKLNQLKEV